MNSMFNKIAGALLISAGSLIKKLSALYNGSVFNPAPSYWALIPVRTGLNRQQENRNEMVQPIINKNKQL